MLVQITRGCPESCTFCNIPSLYGKTTRLKSGSRMIEELDALYDIGWRGSIMVVDDNLVGNQEAIRPRPRGRGHRLADGSAAIRSSSTPR